MLCALLPVVTGCTSGIGQEFAIQLAKSGYNIILVSRDKGKLGTTAASISQLVPSAPTLLSPTQYRYHNRLTVIFSTEARAPSSDLFAIPFDFEKATQKDWQDITAQLQDFDVRILVNNVGRSHAYPEYFAEIPREESDAIIKINIESLVNMTRAVVPNMQAK